MLVLGVNDIHAADKPPSSCTDSYMDDLIDLLMQTVNIARRLNVDAVVWAGDVFNCKAASRVSFALAYRMIAVILAYQCDVYIVPGNHDMANDQLTSIGKTQPLGALYHAGAKMLDRWADNGLPLYGVPWQQTWDDDHVFDALSGYTQERTSPVLVVTHAPLYPPGLELPYEYYPAESWALAMDGGKGSCLYGHVHERHGIWECGGVTFCNPGALSRGSLHEHNLTRIPGIALWDSDTGKFTELSLDAKPASEVFRLEEKAQVVDANGKLDAFLEHIGTAQIGAVSIEKIMAQIRTDNVGPKVERRIEELLYGAEGK